APPRVGLARLGEYRMRIPDGEPLDSFHLAQIPALAELCDPARRSRIDAQLAVYRGGVVRRRFPAGQVLCWQGDPGSTAFYIEEGQVEILMGPQARTPSGTPRDRGTLGWVLRRISRKLRRSSAPDGPV